MKDHIPTSHQAAAGSSVKSLYRHSKSGESLKTYARRLAKDGNEAAVRFLANKAADPHKPPKHVGRTNRIKKSGQK